MIQAYAREGTRRSEKKSSPSRLVTAERGVISGEGIQRENSMDEVRLVRRSKIVVIQPVTLILVIAVLVRVVISLAIAREIPVRGRFKPADEGRFRKRMRTVVVLGTKRRGSETIRLGAWVVINGDWDDVRCRTVRARLGIRWDT